MNKLSHEELTGLRGYVAQWTALWNRFWFAPQDPMILGLLRILVGSMVFYTHLVWSLDLETFFGGDQAILPTAYRSTLGVGSSYLWSHFDWFGGSSIWPVHLVGLVIMALFMFGLWTRVTGVLSALLLISYANRSTGAQFGLDQINGFMMLYLAIGPSGQALSLDRWLANRKGQGRGVGDSGAHANSVLANISVRLMQVHLCIVYFFAGMGKLQGEFWWNGQAIWGAIANYEYQTVDLTWLAEYMWLVNAATYTALLWEVCYPFLVWPKLTRPIFITMAVLVHLGIGLGMGMMTFGLIMVYANLSFVSSSWLRERASNWLPASLL